MEALITIDRPSQIETAEIVGRLEALFWRTNEPMLMGNGADILDANAPMCAMLRRTRESIRTLHIPDLLAGGEEESNRLAKLRAEAGSVSGETTFVTGDGSTLRARYWSVLLPLADGEVRAFSGATPLEVLPNHSETNAMLRSLFDDSPDGKLVVDELGHTIYVNDRHLELWDLTRADTALPFEGRWRKTAARLREPGQFKQMQRVRGNSPGRSFRLELVDGKWLEVRSVPIRGENGSNRGWSSSTRDITAEVQTERAIRENEERYRTLVSSLPVGVVMQYADGRIGTANPAAERILGLTHDQLVGLTSFDPRWRSVKEDGSPYPREEHPAVITLRTGEPCHDVTMGIHHANGTLRWLLVNSEPVGGEDGLEGVVVTFLDVTEQRLAQSALIQARTAEAFNALASGVAHKINNSLAAIVGNAYLAGLPETLPAETVESLTEIMSAASGAANLVRDLQALSGRERNVLESVDLSEIARRALGRLGPDERRRVTVELGERLPTALFDPTALEQAMSSILRNALEAGEFVTLATTAEQRDEVYLDRESAPKAAPAGRFLVFEVTDDGPGIDESVRGRVFEPFATTRFEGRGLGLAAAAGIMATHHGFVEIASSDEGCAARLLIPLA